MPLACGFRLSPSVSFDLANVGDLASSFDLANVGDLASSSDGPANGSLPWASVVWNSSLP